MPSINGNPTDPPKLGGEPAQLPASEAAPVVSTPGAAGEPGRHATNFGRLFEHRRYIRELNRFLDEKVGDGSVPYLYACSVSALPLDTTSISKFPGLLSFHSIQDAKGQYYVYSYWANRDCFELHHDAFVQSLPGALETQNGRLSHTSVKSKTLWERFPFWTVVITVSGVIGAVAALWEQGARLVEPPDITVAFKHDNHLDFESADVPSVSFWVTNQCRFASAEVHIQAIVARKGDPPTPMSEKARLSRIEPGKAADFDIEATDLRAASDQGPPEEYELKLVITAKSGFWRAEKQFPFSSPKFRRWQPVGWTSPTKVRAIGAACYLQGTLYSGRGRNATAIVTASMPALMSAKVDSVVTTLLGMSHTDSEVSPKGEVRRQEFTTAMLKAFKDYPYTIKISSAAMSDEACSKVAQVPDLMTFR